MASHKKIVTFEPIVEFHDALARDELSSMEHSNYWHSREEIESYKRNSAEVIKLIRTGENEFEHMGGPCTLGLEAYAPENEELSRFLSEQSKKDFLVEQQIVRERQLFGFVPDADLLLSKTYGEYSRQALEAAHIRALQTECDVSEKNECEKCLNLKSSTEHTRNPRSLPVKRRTTAVRAKSAEKEEEDICSAEMRLIEVAAKSLGTNHARQCRSSVLEQRHSVMCRSPYRTSLLQRAMRC